MTQYAGSDWIEKSLKVSDISPLGRNVADFLGELFYGIYHLETRWLERVDWSDTYSMSINIGYKSLATFDNNTLTRLVFLAHHMAMRVDIDAATHGFLRLSFNQRQRTGELYDRHPRLLEAYGKFERSVSVPSFEQAHKSKTAGEPQNDIDACPGCLAVLSDGDRHSSGCPLG